MVPKFFINPWEAQNLKKILKLSQPVQETALRLMIFRTNPAQYIQNYLSPNPEQQAQMQQQAPPGQMPNQAGEQNPSLSEPAESSSLAQVGMHDNAQQPNITT